MDLKNVTLSDKYELSEGRAMLSGAEALTRLPMIQKHWDEKAGLRTGGFISGYRGSPIGEYDFTLWSARKYLEANDIVFTPGINEELAATAVWGSQQIENFPEDKAFDGVFGLWYAKGPGVDRAGDTLKHGNMVGSHPNGGVLVVYGDDHNAKSSSIAHQSDQALAANFLPILYPSSVHEYLEYGLKGWAMSRYTGMWVGFKGVNETLGQSATIDLDLDPAMITIPKDGNFPPEGVHFRPQQPMPIMDDLIIKRFKIPLAQLFARENGLDRTVIEKTDTPNLGLVSTGKAYEDTRQALKLLGIDDARARQLGVSHYKVGMIWPLEPVNISAFSEGQKEILVIEEKAAFVEDQLCKILYNQEQRPRVVGKFDERESFLLAADVLLEPIDVAFVIAARLEHLGLADDEIKQNIEALKLINKGQSLDVPAHFNRIPFYCSGCPHNTSTKVPEGSKSFAGIGCHGMAMFYNADTLTVTQMGGEGSNWIGLSPFTKAKHVFQNLGDGTYYHSGLLAIRSSIAAGTNITYKLLFNGVVGMTGGQPIDGPLSVGEISHQILHEGAKKIVVVTDAPENYKSDVGLAPGVEVFHRKKMDRIQKEMREIEGTTVIIYEQACAANKRRLRKRGQYPDPAKRMFINKAVCEGCGDCSVQSNCISVHPTETEFGTKRLIDQSTCNKDYSCVNGFCPSFVTILGGEVAKKSGVDLSDELFANIPTPQVQEINGAYNVMIPGVGGEGVVTIGAILAMAAHVEGKQSSTFVMTGMAQKGGAVYSHLRVAKVRDGMTTAKIGKGESDLILGCDIVASVAPESVQTIDSSKTFVVANNRITPTAAFTQDTGSNSGFDSGPLITQIKDLVGGEKSDFIDASNLALGVTGNTLATNMLMVGFASQKGVLPVGMEAIFKAIELNGVAIPFNKLAFNLGRLAAHSPSGIDELLNGKDAIPRIKRLEKLEDIVAHRKEFLTEYQDENYAKSYQDVVNVVVQKEKSVAPGKSALSVAVARNLAKLMAYKDEYEVARLYSSPEFMESLKDQFSGDIKLKFNLAPPLLSKRDPQTGNLVKREFGGWMLNVFKLLARLKSLRGTAFDIMGYTEERKAERQLIVDYKAMVEKVLETLSADNYDNAVELATTPDRIRGYGHVKELNMKLVKREQEQLLGRYIKGESESMVKMVEVA